MVLEIKDLEKWFGQHDPWTDEKAVDEVKRKNILLNEIPKKSYKSVLHIGCRRGFLTRDLPGAEITAIDFSPTVIQKAKKSNRDRRINYRACSIFDLLKILPEGKKYDLIVISRILYPVYIGKALALIYIIVDRLLSNNGILVTTHVDEHYKGRFPYLLLKEYYCTFSEKTHKIEVYIK